MDSMKKTSIADIKLLSKIYDIPFITPYFQKIKCCRYVPIIPSETHPQCKDEEIGTLL